MSRKFPFNLSQSENAVFIFHPQLLRRFSKNDKYKTGILASVKQVNKYLTSKKKKHKMK